MSEGWLPAGEYKFFLFKYKFLNFSSTMLLGIVYGTTQEPICSVNHTGQTYKHVTYYNACTKLLII